MTDRHVWASALVTISVEDSAPDNVFTRYKYEAGPYGFMTEVQVAEHFASNAIRNGVEDASRLDGWGDLDRYVVTMDVDAYDFEVEES